MLELTKIYSLIFAGDALRQRFIAGRLVVAHQIMVNHDGGLTHAS